ncbi:MAG TPA: peptide chain release factor 3, partial [Limnochordia bacterium]|nr:peptide chain release factor 3 [Limnochordia bacterium]
ERDQKVTNVRLGKDVKLAQPQQFMAQERTQIERAYPGDIVGLFDPGLFRIGDTLCAGGAFSYGDVPQFSPEHFARIRLPNALKRKQLQDGLEQLAQEGAIQLFKPRHWSGVGDTVVAVVGALQLDVLSYRLEHEYGVTLTIERLPYTLARWVLSPSVDERLFQGGRTTIVLDQDERPVVLFENEWALRWIERDHPEIDFAETASRTATARV